MTIAVACSLPAGLILEHDGVEFRLNGSHVGVDMENLPRNGVAEDNAQRSSGHGITILEGKNEEAFLAWVDAVTKSPEGKELQHPYAPIANGAIKWAKSERDVRAQTQNTDGAIGGLDPAKDLPAGLESAPKDDKKG